MEKIKQCDAKVQKLIGAHCKDKIACCHNTNEHNEENKSDIAVVIGQLSPEEMRKQGNNRAKCE
ncbi:hypothetical protein D3C77_438640 [compost metagenome]